MKKSRIAKLALMGASITALAATLTTSTYAWYVSNKTANVNAVSGSTAEGASDGSISLSTSGKVDEYYKTISLTAATNFNAISNGVALEPVTTTNGTTFIQPEFKKATGIYDNTKTYYEQVTTTVYYHEKTLTAGQSTDGLYTKNGEEYEAVAAGGTYSSGTYYEYAPKTSTTYQVKTGIAEGASVANYYVWNATDVTEGNSKFFHMSFYIKSAAGVTVIPTITVKNTTTDVPTAVNYSANGNVLGVDNGATFTIDAIYSLHASLVQTPGEEYTASQTTYKATTPLATQFQAVDGGGNIKATGSSDIAAYDNDKIATGGAHNYFKEIMGYDPYTTAVGYAADKTFGNITLTANTPMKLDYYFWLDGGDDQCLNPCVKQNFEFQFSYTVSA